MFSEALSESQETTRLLQEDMSTIGYGDDERVFRGWLEEGGTHTQANEESVEVVRSLSDPEEPISPSTEGDPDTNTNNNGSPQDGSIAQLTRRLRCLFATLTWPVVPLGTIVSFALLWVLYASFIADARKACSHPLHWYALASLIIVGYAPHHAQARSYFFRYYRERDGPVRPTAVRMYDQLFHTMCIFYVYGGVTLLQTCREDTGHSMEDVYNKDEPPTPAPVDGQPPAENTCAATCPNLYQALSVYVTTLEMFTFSLILPLMFLPCVYVWIIRRASVEADAFSQLQDRLEEEQALLNNGGLTAQEIMDSLEKVKLVSRPVDSSSEPELILLPVSSSDGDTSDARDGSNLKECCICMSEFQVFPDGDIENGTSHQMQSLSSTSGLPSLDPSEVVERLESLASAEEDVMVRTKCGHVFHGKCLAGWIGGRWEPNRQVEQGNTQASSPRRRARRTCCPLCREDLKPSEESSE